MAEVTVACHYVYSDILFQYYCILYISDCHLHELPPAWPSPTGRFTISWNAHMESIKRATRDAFRLTLHQFNLCPSVFSSKHRWTQSSPGWHDVALSICAQWPDSSRNITLKLEQAGTGLRKQLTVPAVLCHYNLSLVKTKWKQTHRVLAVLAKVSLLAANADLDRGRSAPVKSPLPHSRHGILYKDRETPSMTLISNKPE